MTRDNDKIAKIKNQLGNGELQSLSLTLAGFNDDDAVEIAELLKHDDQVTTVVITDSPIGDRGAIALAEALRHHPKVRLINFNGCKIGDEGAKAFADILPGNLTIESLQFMHNQIGDEGGTALAGGLAKNRTLRLLGVDSNPISPEILGAFYDAALESKSPNLTTIVLDQDRLGDSGAAKKMSFTTMSNRNHDDARRAIEKIERFTFDELSMTERVGIGARIPIIRDSMFSDPDCPPNAAEIMDDVEGNVASMPEPDLSQPLSLATLTAKQGNYAPIENPRLWLQLEKTIAAVNAGGERIGADLLLDGKAPSDVLQTAMEMDLAPALFTPDNWKGANAQEFRDVMRAMPETMRSHYVPNAHQMQTQFSRAETREGGRLR